MVFPSKPTSQDFQEGQRESIHDQTPEGLVFYSSSEEGLNCLPNIFRGMSSDFNKVLFKEFLFDGTERGW